jgi:hypothetical protein
MINLRAFTCICMINLRACHVRDSNAFSPGTDADIYIYIYICIYVYIYADIYCICTHLTRIVSIDAGQLRGSKASDHEYADGGTNFVGAARIGPVYIYTAYIYIYVYIYAPIYLYLYIHTYLCIYTYIHTHTHIYIYLYTHTHETLKNML